MCPSRSEFFIVSQAWPPRAWIILSNAARAWAAFWAPISTLYCVGAAGAAIPSTKNPKARLRNIPINPLYRITSPSVPRPLVRCASWRLDARPVALADQHRPAIYIHHFAGDEAGQGRAQEQHRPGDFRRCTHAAYRNAGCDLRPQFSIVERGGRHIGLYPARRNAVHANA